MGSQPVSGGYGCVERGGFYNYCIKKFTHSEYSHCFMVLNASTGLILEAEPHGARFANLSEYHGQPMVFSDDCCLGGDEWTLMEHALPYVGMPYGFLDIAYLGLVLGPHWNPQWMLDAVRDEHRMICSQLVANFAWTTGKNWNCGEPYNQLVTPGLLAARAA